MHCTCTCTCTCAFPLRARAERAFSRPDASKGHDRIIACRVGAGRGAGARAHGLRGLQYALARDHPMLAASPSQRSERAGLSLLAAMSADMWGQFTNAATALWHTRAKVARRVEEVGEWATRHHCALPLLRLECQPRPWMSCAKASWRRCIAVYDYRRCDFKLVNLLGGRRTPSPRSGCWTPPYAPALAGTEWHNLSHVVRGDAVR